MKRSNIKFKKSSTFTCNSCEFAAKSISAINKHKANEHSLNKNTSKRICSPLQSTRNNSIVERLMIEDVSVTDLSLNNVKNVEENTLKYTCFQCNYATTSKELIDNHVEANHVNDGEEEVKFVSIICGHEFDIADDYDLHVKTHEVVASTVNENLVDDAMRELSNLVYCHILDHQVHLMSAELDGDITENGFQLEALQQCHQCDYRATNNTDLNTHKQIKHTSVEVVVKPVSIFKCKACDYVCNLNIKMKKHIQKEHVVTASFNCDLCEFQAHLNKDIWNHKLEKHPDLHEKKDFYSLIAEQNTELKGEVLSMKKLMKEILTQFTYDVEDHINKIKDETKKQNESTTNALSILGREILKLKEKTENEVGPVPEPSYKEPEVSVPKQKLIEKNAPNVPAPLPVNITTKDTSKKITRRKSRYQLKPRILMVGDSLMQEFNFRHLEKATQSTIRTAKGNSSLMDSNNDAENKHINITDITKTELEKAHYDKLVVAAPTHDISNIDTSGIRPGDNTEHLKVKVRESCLNILAAAEHAIDKHNIDQVVVMSHAPRYDTFENDPLKINYNLALFANAHMRKLWLASPFKHKIEIGVNTGSVPNILLASCSSQRPIPTMKSLYSKDHTNCPQARYKRLYSSVVQGEPIRTQNRYSVLNTLSGN